MCQWDEICDPPYRVLAHRYPQRHSPCWYVLRPGYGRFYECDFDKLDNDYYEGNYHDYKDADEMRIIDHPKNDREAVEIIIRATKVRQS